MITFSAQQGLLKMNNTDSQEGEIIPSVNKLDKRMVSEHNDLIKSTANMTALSLKLFEIAVSAVDSKSEHPSRVVKVNKDQVFNALGITGSHRNRQLTDALNLLRRSANFMITLYDDKDVPHDVGISPIYKIDNAYNSDYAEVTFAPEILPFITNLKKNFTQYQLNDILHLKNKYAVSMYRWFTMNYRQYEYYARSGGRTKEQLDKYKNPQLSLSALRKLTGTQKKYRKFYDLKRYVIEPTVEGVSEATKYKISYKVIKNGRKNAAVKFLIEKKGTKTAKPAQPPKKAPKKLSLAEFLSNNYVRLLIGAGLLEMDKVLSNEKYRDNIVNSLFPAYDDFIKEWSMDELGKHLRYVGKHIKKQPVSITNYLLKANRDYAAKLSNKQSGQGKNGSTPGKSGNSKVRETMPAGQTLSDFLQEQGIKDDGSEKTREAVVQYFGEESAEVAEYDKRRQPLNDEQKQALKTARERLNRQKLNTFFEQHKLDRNTPEAREALVQEFGQDSNVVKTFDAMDGEAAD